MKKIRIRYLDDYLSGIDITLAEKLDEEPEIFAFFDKYNTATFNFRLRELFEAYDVPLAEDKALSTSKIMEELVLGYVRRIVDNAKEQDYRTNN